MNILVVAAHPDDEVLGVGGTILKHVTEGDKVFACVLSEGATARYGKNMISVLRKHAEKSAKMLGVSEVAFYDFQNIGMNKYPMLDIVRSIEECILKFRPEIIYTHSKGDSNSDHVVTFEATVAAIRLPERGRHALPVNMIKKVLCFESPSSTEWGAPFQDRAFTPNIFIDIKNSIDKKIEAIKMYETEVKNYPHPRSPEAIRMRANMRGIEAGMEFAEAFMLLRELKV